MCVVVLLRTSFSCIICYFFVFSVCLPLSLIATTRVYSQSLPELPPVTLATSTQLCVMVFMLLQTEKMTVRVLLKGKIVITGYCSFKFIQSICIFDSPLFF